jgi:hypothetical protein
MDFLYHARKSEAFCENYFCQSYLPGKRLFCLFNSVPFISFDRYK